MPPHAHPQAGLPASATGSAARRCLWPDALLLGGPSLACATAAHRPFGVKAPPGNRATLPGRLSLARRGRPLPAKPGKAPRRDGFRYLLPLRLLPVPSFRLADPAPALAGMPFRGYALATLLGIMPGAAVSTASAPGSGRSSTWGGGRIPASSSRRASCRR